MRPSFFVSLIAVVGWTFFLYGCTTDIDINAEPKDIWSVYGVLNPGEEIQQVRIAKGFLPESNAEEVAAEEDLSARDLRVILTDGVNAWTAAEVDSVQKDPGTFFPYTTVYEFDTRGNMALEAGTTYWLEVTKADEPDFRLVSHTTIPDDVDFSSPSPTPGPGGQRCLRQVGLDEEYRVTFDRGQALGFEMRAYFDYTENGLAKQADYGPTNMFTEGVRCRDNESEICYQFRSGEILQAFFQDIDPVAGNVYEYEVNESNRCNNVIADLPDAFRFEVTAIDTFITTYRLANDPKFVDFNTVRPEYTNIKGSEDILVGVFGSIVIGTAPAQLNQCSMYILQLNETPKPDSPCEL